MYEQIKNIPFELKELSESGEFVGYASVFGNVDLGNDVMDPGAFSKTIAERGSKVRLMDGHRVRIGVASVEETATGLKANGKINLAKQSGREAYSDLKFYQENGMPMGMSIGYQTIKDVLPHATKDGARHLKEVRLFEVTVTEFAMNEAAQVTGVKAIEPEALAALVAAEVQKQISALPAVKTTANAAGEGKEVAISEPEPVSHSEELAAATKHLKEILKWN